MSGIDLLSIPEPGDVGPRLQLPEFKGSRFLNLRVWVIAGRGEMRPDKQGATAPLWALGESRQDLERAEAVVQRDGLPRERSSLGPRH